MIIELCSTYHQIQREREDLISCAAAASKAELVSQALNEMPGIQSLPVEGAMYAFPQAHGRHGQFMQIRSIYIYFFSFICICMCIYIYTVYIHIHIYIHKYMYMCICIWTGYITLNIYNKGIFMLARTHVYIYIYTCTCQCNFISLSLYIYRY